MDTKVEDRLDEAFQLMEPENLGGTVFLFEHISQLFVHNHSVEPVKNWDSTFYFIIVSENHEKFIPDPDFRHLGFCLRLQCPLVSTLKTKDQQIRTFVFVFMLPLVWFVGICFLSLFGFCVRF